jgi:cytochrome P450
MTTAAHIHPTALIPPEEPMGPLAMLRATVANPIQIWPASVYREPIVRWRAFGVEMMFVMAPDLIRQVLVDDADAFDKGEILRRAFVPIIGEGILTADGAHWRWQRRAAAPIFRPDAIRRYVPTMLAAAERTRERWLACPPGTELNVAHEMTRTTFDVILETMLPGSAKLDAARTEKWITDYLESIGWVTAMALLRLPPWVPYPGYWRARRATRHLRDMLDEVVAERHREPGHAGDLPTQLMAAKDPETGRAMDDRELTDNLLTFISAGHETTAVALTWTFYLLSLYPDIEERAVREVEAVTNGGELRPEHIDALTYTQQIFLEAMRLYPPAPAVARTAIRDVKIGPELVTKGTPLYVPTYALHRHAALWEEPDRFDPERFGRDAVKARHRYAYIPFGAGPRVCIGMGFAVAEGVAVLATLLRKVRLRLRPGHVPQLRMRATLRPAGGMPMTVERRT